MKKLALCIPVLLALSGCDQIKSLFVDEAKCSSEESMALVKKSLLPESITTEASKQIKELVEGGVGKLDMSKLRAYVNQISFDLTDIRTVSNDPQSSRKFCGASLKIRLPDTLVNEANASREIIDESSVSDLALLNDIKIESNLATYNFQYSVQTTDDGKKTLGQLENADSAVSFLKEIVLDAMLKNHRKEQALEAKRRAAAERAAAAKAAAAEYAYGGYSEAADAVAAATAAATPAAW